MILALLNVQSDPAAFYGLVIADSLKLLLLCCEGASGDLQFLSSVATAVCTRVCISGLLWTLDSAGPSVSRCNRGGYTYRIQGLLLQFSIP